MRSVAIAPLKLTTTTADRFRVAVPPPAERRRADPTSPTTATAARAALNGMVAVRLDVGSHLTSTGLAGQSTAGRDSPSATYGGRARRCSESGLRTESSLVGRTAGLMPP